MWCVTLYQISYWSPSCTLRLQKVQHPLGSRMYMWALCPLSVLTSYLWITFLPFSSIHPPPPLILSLHFIFLLIHSVTIMPPPLFFCASLCLLSLPICLACVFRCPRWAFCRALKAVGMSGAHRMQGRRRNLLVSCMVAAERLSMLQHILQHLIAARLRSKAYQLIAMLLSLFL